MSVKLKIGQQIRELREARGWTQEQLAEAMGVSKPRVADLENGRGNPTVDTLDIVAKALKKKLHISIQ